MSYTRHYSEIVTGRIHKTVYVDYTDSQNKKGTVPYTIDEEVDIPVEVNINVDTLPFDRSVQNCGTNVDLLTTAVVATETAEIASKEKNSKKVADTIIGGFFSYIRSEISQQVAELSQHIDAQLMHLRELAQSCMAKKKQMEGDFNRISSRYVKIFEDLNNELSNRIYELDKPAFLFKKETDNQKIRTSDNDLVNIVAIFGQESSSLQSKINASITKKRALDTLKKAKIFLSQQKKLNAIIQQSMLNESISTSLYAPVCFFESKSSNNEIDKSVFSAVLKDNSQKNMVIEKFTSDILSWDKISEVNKKSINLYFNSELNSKTFTNDTHSVRVREMIQKISNIGLINTIQ